jgi:AraC-like DNA-binding protein
MSNVRAASLSNYLEVAAQLGLDGKSVLRQAGIDQRVLSDPDVQLPGSLVANLLETSAAIAECPTFGLRMAETRRLSDFGAVSLLIGHQPTMRDALMTVINYRQLVNESLAIDVEEHLGVVVVREELELGAGAPTRQAYELAIGVVYRLFRAVLGGRWRAQSVNFAHAAPPDLTVHRRVFGPIVEFNCDFNGLTCRRDDLDAPNPSADARLAQLAEQFVRTLPNADRRSFTQEVCKALYQLLPTGGSSIGKVAAKLGLNERTLQRRLIAEGADFRGLLEEVRRELTLRYLANDALPLTRVAGMVGYSQLSSFSRWFAEAFGTAPSAWRAAQTRDV